LREKGITKIDDLLREFDESKLANFQKPWGSKTQKVGKAAEKILRFSRALASGKEEVLQTPALPPSENYVMFDLEGLPPQLDELDKIYLWGLQVFGAKPSEYLGKIADIGSNGDRVGWDGFLEAAKSVFDTYGDVPFIHWTHYERTKVSAYVERYGDKDGIAERLKRNLVDLFPITQSSIALPIPSYSLKVVEKYIGYKRSQTEYGGDWAMAAFIKATETSDENKRKELLESILTYNREDLGATWAVFGWLRTKKAN
jgi:predicted RecB family nuclease